MKTTNDLLLYALLLLTAIACGKESKEPELVPNDGDAVVRVAVYNTHWCTGIDGVLNPQRIAEVLKGLNADVIALNEIDRHYDPRSNYEDQLQIIADALDMNYQFQKTTWKSAIPASGNKPREFGHAILSKEPITFLNARIFDAHSKHYHGLLETKIIVKNKPILFYITHLDTDPTSLQSQSVQLKQWMSEKEGTKILMGDLNAVPDNSSIKYITNGMVDAFQDQPNAFTFKSNNPTIRIDYIIGSEDVEFVNSNVVKTLASDHFPIVTEIKVQNQP